MAPTTTDPTEPTAPRSDDPTAVDTDWTQVLPPPPAPPPPARHPERPPRRRRSKLLLVVGIAFAAISIIWGCITVLDLLAWESETVHRSFSGVQKIELASHCGGVSIVADQTAGGPTRVVRRVRRGLRSPEADETLAGSTLRLHSRCPVFPQTFNNVAYEVHVPADISVEGSAAERVHLTDVTGPIDVRTSDGGVTVTGATSGVTAHAGDGSIHVSDSAGPIDVSTSDGGITVEGTRAPSVSAHTGDGGITLDLLNAPDRISARTGDGGITVTLPSDAPVYKVSTHTGDGGVTNGIRSDPTAPRTLEARTGDGGITLGLRAEG